MCFFSVNDKVEKCFFVFCFFTSTQSGYRHRIPSLMMVEAFNSIFTDTFGG